MPQALARYEALCDAHDAGISRVFGYASIVADPGNVKPAGSRHLADERAQLPGMEVAMNVLAAGENEFRGTRGTYTDEAGKQQAFANVGVYAGLENASGKDGYADGVTITARKEDRRESLIAYIDQELGQPPKGLKLDDLFNPEKRQEFAALKGSTEDEFGMYKFQLAQVQTRGPDGTAREVPAVTVATNEKSLFAATNLSPMETAHLILDGQGWRRSLGGDDVGGGGALDYFKNYAIGSARKLGLHQPKLEAIDEAIDRLAAIYAQTHQVLEKKLPPAQEQKYFDVLNSGELKGIYSPHFFPGENANCRPEVSAEEKAKWPENNSMAHTAEEKFARVADLQAKGKTGRSRQA